MFYPSESEWAWLGGVIDGEGHISMLKRRNGQMARRVAITNCNLPLLVAIAAAFGGKIHTHTPPKPKHRQQFQWYTYGDHARMVLHGALPYLIVKREEAEIFLAFAARTQPGKWGSHLKTTELAAREKLLARVEALRARTWTLADVPAEYTSKVTTS